MIAIVIYAAGVYMAYFQIQRWGEAEITKVEDWHTLFRLSLLSWLIYPLYGVVQLFRKYGDG